MTFADVATLARELPGVEPSTSYVTPSLKVRSKMLVRMKEGGESEDAWREAAPKRPVQEYDAP
ncbi:MAG: hypothetical protein ABIT20_08175 [Gemmatimonadaceae bacterium]